MVPVQAAARVAFELHCTVQRGASIIYSTSLTDISGLDVILEAERDAT